MSKLYFRYGAMGAGKSTMLMQVAHNYEEKGLKVLVVKSVIDTKGDDKLVSRIGIERKVDVLLQNGDILSKVNTLKNISCILVDEAQFLNKEQVEDLWYISKELDIPVICYGLKVNFRGELFTGSKRLMELADTFDELITICKCGKKARFNARKVNGAYALTGDDVVIDGTKNIEYEALCGKCYLEKVILPIKKL